MAQPILAGSSHSNFWAALLAARSWTSRGILVDMWGGFLKGSDSIRIDPAWRLVARLTVGVIATRLDSAAQIDNIGEVGMIAVMKKRSRKSDAHMAMMDPKDSLPIVIHDYTDVALETDAALSLQEFSDRMGVSCSTVDYFRECGALIALPKGQGEFVYPDWQLDESGKSIPEVQMILGSLHPIAKSPVEMMVQLLAKSAFYEGRSIKDFICEGDLKLALEAAQIRTLP